MRRILVTGAHGDIGQSIGRVIRRHWPEVELHGADVMPGQHPAAFTFAAVHRLPAAADPRFQIELAALQSSHHYDLIIPVPEPELVALARSGRGGLPLLMNSDETILRFCDKLETHRWLEDKGLRSPHTFVPDQIDQARFPAIFKPRSGWGSRGLMHVGNRVEAGAALALVKGEYIVQAHVGTAEDEYTCAVVKLGGAVNKIQMRRLLSGGLTSQATVTDHAAIDNALDRLATYLPGGSFINVQLRFVDNSPWIFEINPRFSSTVALRDLAGFADVKWMIESRSGGGMDDFTAPVGRRMFRIACERIV